MNKVFRTLSYTSSRKEVESRKPKTSGKLYDWCTEQLKPLGLNIDLSTPYQLGVYRGEQVVGYYHSLTEIKAAIKDGSVSSPHNL